MFCNYWKKKDSRQKDYLNLSPQEKQRKWICCATLPYKVCENEFGILKLLFGTAPSMRWMFDRAHFNWRYTHTYICKCIYRLRVEIKLSRSMVVSIYIWQDIFLKRAFGTFCQMITFMKDSLGGSQNPEPAKVSGLKYWDAETVLWTELAQTAPAQTACHLATRGFAEKAPCNSSANSAISATKCLFEENPRQFYEKLKVMRQGAPEWFSGLSICLGLRLWSWGSGIEPLSWASCSTRNLLLPLPLLLPPAHDLYPLQINKENLKKKVMRQFWN